MKNKYDLIIVGAGAAGIIAAGRAAELGAKVLLVEKMKQAGRKLLITGKGRCNISNDASQSEYYKNIFPNGRYLKHAFAAFFSDDIVKLLNENGVPTTKERGNRIFPTSNSAKDVHSGLMRWMNRHPVEILYQATVKQLIIEDECIQGVKAEVNRKISEFRSEKVIICTGGKSYPATGSTGDGYSLAKEAGHTIHPVRPALVPLVVSGNMAADLQGLSLKNVRASVWIDGRKFKEEFGEMLFTHFGLSGPIILTLSRFVVEELAKKNKIEISIDLKPALDEIKLDSRLLRDIDTNGKKQIRTIFKQWLPAKLIPVILTHLKIDGRKETHQLSSKERRRIMLLMKNFRFEIETYRGFEEAIITSGGVSTSEIDGRTMQSKLINGLYFAGEVLDLDANTGGYNLQIAYSTAWLAAECCVKQNNLLCSAVGS